MPATDLQSTIEAAWEDRANVSAATRGAVREAVETALAMLDAGVEILLVLAGEVPGGDALRHRDHRAEVAAAALTRLDHGDPQTADPPRWAAARGRNTCHESPELSGADDLEAIALDPDVVRIR